MDLVAVSPKYMQTGQRIYCQRRNELWKLMDHVNKTGLAQPGTATAVPRAKVPIVKFTEKITAIKVDISFENDSGLRANGTFQQWKVEYPVMPVIVVMIKQLLAMRNLNEVFTGGLGGFSIICLVVSMLQLMPDDEREQVNTSDQPYAELFLKFLDLYGNKFNIRETGITMNPPGFFDKIRYPSQVQNDRGLTIIDPNNPSNDISGGSREVHTVFEVFRKAHSQIMQRMDKIVRGKEVEVSILGCVLGGNYNSFIKQRNRLYKLYSGDSLSPPPEPARKVQAPSQKRKKPKTADQEPAAKGSRIDDHFQGMSGAPPPPPPPGPAMPLSARVEGGPPAPKRYVDYFEEYSSSSFWR